MTKEQFLNNKEFCFPDHPSIRFNYVPESPRLNRPGFLPGSLFSDQGRLTNQGIYFYCRVDKITAEYFVISSVGFKRKIWFFKELIKWG